MYQTIIVRGDFIQSKGAFSESHGVITNGGIVKKVEHMNLFILLEPSAQMFFISSHELKGISTPNFTGSKNQVGGPQIGYGTACLRWRIA